VRVEVRHHLLHMDRRWGFALQVVLTFAHRGDDALLCQSCTLLETPLPVARVAPQLDKRQVALTCVAKSTGLLDLDCPRRIMVAMSKPPMAPRWRARGREGVLLIADRPCLQR